MDAIAEDRLFDRAVAHWNARGFHPAHEDWETLWNDAEGGRRAWLQGLIQYAAALFHYERGFYASGFVKLMRSAAERVSKHDARDERIRFDALTRDLAPWHAQPHVLRTVGEVVERDDGIAAPRVVHRENGLRPGRKDRPIAPAELGTLLARANRARGPVQQRIGVEPLGSDVDALVAVLAFRDNGSDKFLRRCR